MKILKAFRFLLELTEEQTIYLSRLVGCARFVWNKALSLQKGRLEGKIPLLSYYDLAKLLTLWRSSEEYGFLAEGPVHTQQWALKFLDQAIREGMDPRNPKKFPDFRKKGAHDYLRFPDKKQIKLDLTIKDSCGRSTFPQIFLPKIGFVKMRMSREIKGEIRNVTVTRVGNKWFVSIQTEQEIQEPIHESQTGVGLDLGVVRFATLSNKDFIEPLDFKKLEEKIAWEQRKLSRKKKFSGNWIKQKKAVQRVHTKIANMRNDFLHKTSTEICKNHAVIGMEDLKIANMSASAKGTLEEPGTNVKAKSGLNRSILRQGWYAFRKMVEYKLSWRGGKLILVNPRNSSTECPRCHCIHAENRKSQAEFECIECHYKDHADYVGALTVAIRAGLAQFACCFEQEQPIKSV